MNTFLLNYILVYLEYVILVGRCMAVDREFACILFCVCIYFVMWWPLRVSLASPFLSLNRLWAPLGSLWTALGSFWDALGCHGGPLGLPSTYNKFLTKKDIQFRANGSQVRSPPTKSGLLELLRRARGSSGFPQSAWPAAPNSPSLARGARITWV